MENAQNVQKPNLPDGLGPEAIGRVDWSPLSVLTMSRPNVSKYGLPRYSPMEWRKANQKIFDSAPAADALEHEGKALISKISSEVDKEQFDNTLRLKQRAADIYSHNIVVCQYCKDLKDEVEKLAKMRARLKKAVEVLEVVERINGECREIRKNRIEEDLVRDVVEEELFQEKGLCEQIHELYNRTLDEFDNAYRNTKSTYLEIQNLWSDEKETLEYETENIGYKNSSPEICYYHGNARFQPEMSTGESWEKYMQDTLGKIKGVIDASKDLRFRINSPIIEDSAKDLKAQSDKVVGAFLKRIEEVDTCRQSLESELDKVLKEIAHCENLFTNLDKLGRRLDFALKVVQSRLENRSKRPGAEKCRDKPQYGLIHEIKGVCEKVSGLQTQQGMITDALNELYAKRKNLEKQILVKRNSLILDQRRCMLYRSKFPNIGYLRGFS